MSAALVSPLVNRGEIALRRVPQNSKNLKPTPLPKLSLDNKEASRRRKPFCKNNLKKDLSALSKSNKQGVQHHSLRCWERGPAPVVLGSPHGLWQWLRHRQSRPRSLLGSSSAARFPGMMPSAAWLVFCFFFSPLVCLRAFLLRGGSFDMLL